MEKQQGKNPREPGKNSRESKPQKLFAKLPPNYSELTPEEQKEWRKRLAQTILERHRK
jgi:hypothetical protein